MSKTPALKYIVLSEGAGPHHVLVERAGSAWLQRVAAFQSLDRAGSFAEIENDMLGDDVGAPEEAKDKPPTDMEPASGLPALAERARGSERREVEALTDGFKHGRSAEREAAAEAPAPPAPIAERPPISVNSIDVRAVVDDQGRKSISIVPIKSGAAAPIPAEPANPAPVVEPAPQPKPKYEPVRQPTPVKPARPATYATSRLETIVALEKRVLADMPALMVEFPRGPSTGDLQKRYDTQYDYIGHALRQLAERDAIRYEKDKDGPQKYARPIDFAGPRPTGDELTTIQESVLRVITETAGADGCSKLSKNEMARAAGISIGSIEAALDALDVKKRIERLRDGGPLTASRYRLAGWKAPAKPAQNITENIPMSLFAPSNEGEKSEIEAESDAKSEPALPISDQQIDGETEADAIDEAASGAARAEQMREFESEESRAKPRQELAVIPAPAALPAIRVSPTAQALADFQKSRLAKAAQSPLARIVDHTPEHPPFVDLGEPPPHRSALFERQVEQERALRRQEAET